jgi:hypothetical protein
MLNMTYGEVEDHLLYHRWCIPNPAKWRWDVDGDNTQLKKITD